MQVWASWRLWAEGYTNPPGAPDSGNGTIELPLVLPGEDWPIAPNCMRPNHGSYTDKLYTRLGDIIKEWDAPDPRFSQEHDMDSLLTFLNNTDRNLLRNMAGSVMEKYKTRDPKPNEKIDVLTFLIYELKPHERGFAIIDNRFGKNRPRSRY